MKEETSALVDEVLVKFLDALVDDDKVPAHVTALLRQHFETRSSISPAELRVILSSTQEVS